MVDEVAALVGRRERKKQQTRAALRSAAVRLVGQRGLDAVTIEDITEAADVSPRTFSNYFASKEDALTAPDPDRLSRLRAELAARPAEETPLQALRAVLVADTEALARRRDEWMRQIAVVKSDPRLMAAQAGSWLVLERDLAAGLAARPDVDDLQAQVVAAVGVAALRVAVRRWKTGSRTPLAQILGDAIDALADATGRSTSGARSATKGGSTIETRRKRNT
jgi:AcrR family transcriptional regulator